MAESTVLNKGYVVKVMMYLDAEGTPVKKLSDAQLFKDKELAELTAEISNGWSVVVLRPDKVDKPAKKQKSKRKNQSWIKEMK